MTDQRARLGERSDLLDDAPYLLAKPAGCGFWLFDPTHEKYPPAEWWECSIPDDAHHGRDHILVRARSEPAA